MKTKQTLLVIGMFFGITFQSPAIEGLTLSIQSDDVVLRWPSLTDETYIVQYRESLDETNTWQTLTNDLPAALGTNRTSFVHVGAVCVPPEVESSGGGIGEAPPAPGSYSSTSSTSLTLSGGGYPPMPPSPWDFNQDGSFESFDNYSTSNFSMSESSSGEGSGSVGSCGGFYRVVRNGIFLVGVTNGATISGQVPLAIEVGFEGVVSSFSIHATNGSSIDGIKSVLTEDGRTMNFIWDTAQTQNGVYQLVPTSDSTITPPKPGPSKRSQSKTIFGFQPASHWPETRYGWTHTPFIPMALGGWIFTTIKM